jgi:hypothetical protein
MPQNLILKKHIYNILPYLIFFTGSFIFFGFFADYVEFYQEKISLFIFSHDYLIDNLSQPGSLLVYLGRFLTTFYYYPALGGVIISLIVCLIIIMTSKIISFISGKESIILPLIFGTAFFILHSNYYFLLYNSLGVLLQLLFFYLAIKFLKGFIPVIIYPFWYFLTGGFAWIFALMYTIHLALKSIKKGWPEIITLVALCFLIIYVLKEFFLFQTFRNLMIFPFSKEDTGSQIKFFIAVMVLITLIPLYGKIKISVPFWIKLKEPLKVSTISFVSLLLIIVSAFLRFDKVNKEYFHAEKLFHQKRFKEIPEYIAKHPTTNRLTVFLNNIALCETGKLNDQLFHTQQSPDGQSLFLKWEMLGEVLRRGGYFYYATGMINEAQRWAFENMVMKGMTPDDLRMLIKTEIINGDNKVASKYISILKKTLFYRNEARDYQKLLFNDKAVESDQELGARREEKVEHDFFSMTGDPYANLEMAMTVDSLNRNAFEYKMAYIMLKEDYSGIASGLAKLKNYGYKKIPVHLEEAALVYRLSKSGPMPDMGNLSIDPRTEARFNQFLQTFKLYGNDIKIAQPFLKKKFGDTFWYYAFYH